MLGASAYFAFKIYEHIQTLQEPSLDDTKRVKLSDDEVEELINDGDEARQRGDLDRALAIYSEAKVNQPKNAEILFKMGYTMSELERYDEALEYFENSLKYDDENPFAYLEISKIYKKLGDDEKAELYYEKGVEIDEDIKDL
jgi:tetratricopeptide (TPR) repeat protein